MRCFIDLIIMLSFRAEHKSRVIRKRGTSFERRSRWYPLGGAEQVATPASIVSPIRKMSSLNSIQSRRDCDPVDDEEFWSPKMKEISPMKTVTTQVEPAVSVLPPASNALRLNPAFKVTMRCNRTANTGKS